MYEKCLETMKYLHEMTGLKEYMEQRILNHYKVMTLDSTMRLCLRSIKTYEMIDEWIKFIDLIDQWNSLSNQLH